MRIVTTLGAALIGLSMGGAFAQEQELTVDDIVELLRVPGEDEVTFNARGIAPVGRIDDIKVMFEFDSAVLTPEAKTELDKYGQALAKDALASDSFLIAGHTDAAGSDDYNMDLSKRRAASVVRYLESSHGISSDRLASEGYGETKLANSADPMSHLNRRVEIVNKSPRQR